MIHDPISYTLRFLYREAAVTQDPVYLQQLEKIIAILLACKDAEAGQALSISRFVNLFAHRADVESILEAGHRAAIVMFDEAQNAHEKHSSEAAQRAYEYALWTYQRACK